MSASELQADKALERVRERIRRNFPDPRAPLHWAKVSDHRIRSTDGKFAIDRSGEGDEIRFTAWLLPLTVIGHKLRSAEEAKEICYRHASPLPLGDAPPLSKAAAESADERKYPPSGGSK